MSLNARMKHLMKHMPDLEKAKQKAEQEKVDAYIKSQTVDDLRILAGITIDEERHAELMEDMKKKGVPIV